MKKKNKNKTKQNYTNTNANTYSVTKTKSSYDWSKYDWGNWKKDVCRAFLRIEVLETAWQIKYC